MCIRDRFYNVLLFNSVYDYYYVLFLWDMCFREKLILIKTQSLFSLDFQTNLKLEELRSKVRTQKQKECKNKSSFTRNFSKTTPNAADCLLNR